MSSTVIHLNKMDLVDSGLIKAYISEVFRITTPRYYQIEVIHHCIYNNNATVYIIRKTAEGKSLITQTVAALKGRGDHLSCTLQ